ncbi:MAG TPA: hypothetical protein VN737_04265 [Bryobacteraceae bacterium]|nr:hypothetical protein [Bryobacteraceae bacterium]
MEQSENSRRDRAGMVAYAAAADLLDELTIIVTEVADARGELVDDDLMQPRLRKIHAATERLACVALSLQAFAKVRGAGGYISVHDGRSRVSVVTGC